jgi:hypothetical protein
MSVIEAPREHWQMRLYRGLHDRATGEQTFEACLLRAVLGKQRNGLPRIGSKAIIDPDGRIIADFWGKNGIKQAACWLRDENGNGLTTISLGAKFRRVADLFDLADDERQELFVEVARWIMLDMRVKSNLG